MGVEIYQKVVMLDDGGLGFLRFSFLILTYNSFIDKNLLDAIRAKTRPAFEGDTVDYRHMYDDCPRSAAIPEKTLRLTFGSISVRKVAVPIAVGTKVLKPGNPVPIPIRQLHYNGSAFGGNAGEFDVERFLEKKKSDQKHELQTYCPRRFLAKREVLVFVATVLLHFDVEVSNETGVL